MNKILKSTLTLLLGVVFVAMPMTHAKAATNPPPTINYVALGDSIAAGVLYSPTDPKYGEKNTIFGYANVLKDTLVGAGFKVNFNNLSMPGMTAQVLAAQSGPDNPAYKLVQSAQLVTLDVGANDLLGGFYGYISQNQAALLQNPPNPIFVAGLKDTLNKTLQSLYFGSKGTEVQKNIETILQNILKANPKAQIYVMGYYNAIPALKDYGMDLTLPTAYFNTFIYKAICNVRARNRGASISYVDTMLAMSDGVNRKLLYPTDIHPTVQGYQVIGNLFWQRIKINYLISQYINTRVH